MTLEDGSQGTGYTYTAGKGGHAIQAMIEHDLAGAILGRDGSDIHSIWDFLEGHIHYVGRGGIASFAISAIDIALWDLRGKREGRPLWQLAGGAARSCNAYYGGIDLQFPLDKLLANISGYLAQGYRAVKIKVGRERLEEDQARPARGHTGPAARWRRGHAADPDAGTSGSLSLSHRRHPDEPPAGQRGGHRR